MTIFDLLDGRDPDLNNSYRRQVLHCILRQGYVAPLSPTLLTQILGFMQAHHVCTELRFNSNMLNPLMFRLDGYAMFHLRSITDPVTRYNWGDPGRLLLDLLEIPGCIIKVQLGDHGGPDNTQPVHVLGECGEIVKSYTPQEIDH